GTYDQKRAVAARGSPVRATGWDCPILGCFSHPATLLSCPSRRVRCGVDTWRGSAAHSRGRRLSVRHCTGSLWNRLGGHYQRRRTGGRCLTTTGPGSLPIRRNWVPSTLDYSRARPCAAADRGYFKGTRLSGRSSEADSLYWLEASSCAVDSVSERGSAPSGQPRPCQCAWRASVGAGSTSWRKST